MKYVNIEKMKLKFKNNAGFNRLTSLIQICDFLGYVTIENDIIHFKSNKFIA